MARTSERSTRKDAERKEAERRDAERNDPDAIQFRGIPASLSAIIAEGASQTGDVLIALAAAPVADAPLELHVQIDIDPRIVRVTLPTDTPPGRYEGTLTNGDAPPRAAVLEVEAAPHLRVVPEQMRLDARPGETVHRSLNVINAGNVAMELRRVQAFGVFMAGGVERALRRGYVRTLARNERRVDVIADHLADAHGGLVKMTITLGAGTIPPGVLQAIEVDVKIPGGLASGSVYGGNWEMPGLVYPVTITVAGDAPATEDETDDADDERHDSPYDETVDDTNEGSATTK